MWCFTIPKKAMVLDKDKKGKHAGSSMRYEQAIAQLLMLTVPSSSSRSTAVKWATAGVPVYACVDKTVTQWPSSKFHNQWLPKEMRSGMPVDVYGRNLNLYRSLPAYQTLASLLFCFKRLLPCLE